MSAKSFEEWCESPEGSEAAIRNARAIHSGPHAYGEAAWTASRAALLSERPDVAGLVERIENVIFADEHCTDDMLKRETISALESLAAQLAQRDEEIAKLRAEFHALQRDVTTACNNILAINRDTP